MTRNAKKRPAASRAFFALLLTFNIQLSGCGDNLYGGFEAANPQLEATQALEKQNPQQAISITLAALGASYRSLYLRMTAAIANGETNTIRDEANQLSSQLFAAGDPIKVAQLLSILSSAHAQLYGIDPLDIALALAEDSSEASSSLTTLLAETSGNDLALLFPILPAGTTENINGLTGARIILGSIGSDHLTQADYFKQALYLTANVALVSKQLDSDGDGIISVLEAGTLTANNAEIVLDLLLDAATSALDSGEAGDSKAAGSAAKITTIRETILNGEGANDTEKVQAYLGSKNTP